MDPSELDFFSSRREYGWFHTCWEVSSRRAAGLEQLPLRWPSGWLRLYPAGTLNRQPDLSDGSDYATGWNRISSQH
jgi:hypothetical protein